MLVRHLRRLALVPPLFAVAGCMTQSTLRVPDAIYQQRVAYVRDLFHDQERIARLGYDLSTRAADLCGAKTTYTTGAYLFDWDQTAESWLDAANDAIGINLHTPGIEVLIVIPGSPADVAGLQVGDRILKLGDWPVPKGRGAFRAFRGHLDRQLRAGRAPIAFRIIRDGVFRSVSLTPIRSCDYPVLISEAGQANAYTDGDKIVVMRGMVEFARSDADLAVVIAHELSHIILGHIDQRKRDILRAQRVGAIFDVLIAGATGIRANLGQQVFADLAALTFSKRFEAEADYFGAYLMARAGYDVAHFPEFQLYFGGSTGMMLQYSSTHPTFSERARMARITTEEILQKQKRGETVAPDIAAFRSGI